MRAVLVVLAFLLVAGSGCKPKPAPPETTARKDAGASGGAGYGALQNVRKAVQRTVTSAELESLRIYISDYSLAGDRMPSKDEIIAAALKSGDRKLHEALQEGLIVLTGAKSREGVWAYEKDAPTNGGMVLTSQGIERLTAAELKQRLMN